jgi:thymidine phosphorylase
MAAPDPTVGIVLFKKVGDPVAFGEPLAELHCRADSKIEEVQPLLKAAFRFSVDRVNPPGLVWKVVE